MDSHLLTDGSDLTKSFKNLPRSSRAPSGRTSNNWYFDLRYIQLSPPSHVVFIFQPESSYVHQERIPCDIQAPGGGILFFPENAKDAAPEIAKALMHGFVHGLGNQQIMGRNAPPSFAPWKLSTEDRNIAKEVGQELKRLGVAKELWTVDIAGAKTLQSADDAFGRLFSSLTTNMGLIVSSTPTSIQFRPTDVPAGYDLEHHSSIVAFSSSLQNTKPPSVEYMSGKVAPGQELMRDMEIASKLLEAKSAAVIKAEGDAGDPIAATDYGIRLYHGIGCPLDRRGSRAYLVQAATSLNATAETKAMAHAMLVTWHVEHFKSPGKAIVARYLFAGAYHANESARIIRPVLPNGSAAAPAVLITVPMLEQFSATVPELNFLCKDAFRAYKDRMEQMEKGRAKMDIKRMDRPNRYRCANPGCGIEADTGRVLLQCSGRCDRDKKPSYCGPVCQKVDWKNHKPFCKAGAPCSVIDTAFTTTPSSHATPGAIQLPMGGITVSSSTMTPEFMKEIKEHLDGLTGSR